MGQCEGEFEFFYTQWQTTHKSPWSKPNQKLIPTNEDKGRISTSYRVEEVMIEDLASA